ncbi:divalent metal cation transporter [Kribbella sp. NPDC056861]|uniref:NRAMP family divalent metal transporter n=1 Tax=Kribbella sp. NPDC056861 TaxID=3154857 RepID=UPI0034216FBA
MPSRSGILTAIGGFVDIGDLVTNALVGARFGMRLSWVVVVGVIGICRYAEMSGRVVAVSGRPVLDPIRERLGRRTGLVALVASFPVTLLTLIAETGGVALAFELATGVNYLLWVPLAALAVWLVTWRVKFSQLETMFGLMGLLLIIFAVALWKLGPDWGELLHRATNPQPIGHEIWATYAYYAIALFGAAMTPCEVFFFSCGGVEVRWSRRDLSTERSNMLIGFPLGSPLCSICRTGPGGDARAGDSPGGCCLRQTRAGDRADRCSRRPSVRHSRRRCRAATRSRSTSGGSGASSSGRGRPRASSW